jgi:hypothetical protein
MGCKAFLSKLPSRVLDISANIPRLLEFQDDELPEGVYATMSHCWGNPEKSRPAMTTKDTLESRKIGIEPDELSPLFRDAIQLCKVVGCNFIWIDSLCIIQDDESDRTVQSQKMSQIYSNAYFNIAATSSADSTRSLFQERWSVGTGNNKPPPHCPVLNYNIYPMAGRPVCVRQAHSRDHVYVQGRMPNLRWHQAPLLDRAWVLQEVLLARRTLHVCSSELIWECRTMHDCECGSFDSDSLVETTGPSRSEKDQIWLDALYQKQEFDRMLVKLYPMQAIHDFWLRLSQRYSTLLLTRLSDRFAAFAGLVDVVQRVLHGTYLAGIWSEDLPRALLWYGTPRSSPNASRLSSAPTWSWMSRRVTDGSCRILYDHMLIQGFRQEPRTSISTVMNPSQLNETNSLGITFQGPVILARIQLRPIDFSDDSPIPPDIARNEIYIIPTSMPEQLSGSNEALLWADCPMSSDDPLLGGEIVKCLLIGTNEEKTAQFALVIKRCDWMDGDYYRRVGVAEFELKDEDENPDQARHYFSDVSIRNVKLI